MAELRLEHVTKRFGTVEAVKDVTLEVQDGEFFCVLGPPSSGKSILLRLIVGLERPDEGTIYIDDEPVNDVHPGKRDIAMIFQNLALYPDKTVFDNIAFPLRERKVSREVVRKRVTNVARTLHIDHLLARTPGKLSGGERQRVAIGRAIVRRPRAYLMDEPLANLDALLRAEMRVELKHLQQDLGQTLVYVTNDQVEAMSMADRIAVFDQGALQQCDGPLTIYNRPANAFVATLVGSPPMNLFTCDLVDANGTLNLVHEAFTLQVRGNGHPLQDALRRRPQHAQQVLVGIRPENIRLLDTSSSERDIPATVTVTEPLGAETVVDVRLGHRVAKVLVPPTQEVLDGQPAWVQFDPAKIHVFDADSKLRLYSTDQSTSLACKAHAHG